MKRDLVVKDNSLINASYNLDLVEQRLVLLAIVEARESGQGISADSALTIHASRYMEQFGVDRHAAYKALKQACIDLFERQFSYQKISTKGKVTHVTSRWVSRIEYTEQDATVGLIFSPDVVPLITRLERQFTSYDLEQVAALDSRYSVRLYELLMQFKDTGRCIIELEQFRNALGVGVNEYIRPDNFKRRVIDLAINQINEYTNIKVRYKPIKAGVKITGYTFTFIIKKPAITDSVTQEGRDENTPDMFTGKTDSEIRSESGEAKRRRGAGAKPCQAV